MVLAHFHANHVGARLCSSLGIDYAPVIWPGTSADHLNGGNKPADLDYFPRYNGTFYEMQATSAMTLDPTFIFTAMFDEVNEGKAQYFFRFFVDICVLWEYSYVY